mgnify:CR=1 FL=1
MKLGDMELLDHLVVDAELAFAEGCFDEAKERAAAAIPYIEQALKEEAKKGKRAGKRIPVSITQGCCVSQAAMRNPWCISEP